MPTSRDHIITHKITYTQASKRGNPGIEESLIKRAVAIHGALSKNRPGFQRLYKALFDTRPSSQVLWHTDTKCPYAQLNMRRFPPKLNKKEVVQVGYWKTLDGFRERAMDGDSAFSNNLPEPLHSWLQCYGVCDLLS